jgi:hypothetical protein
MKKVLIGLTLLTVVATTLAACGGEKTDKPAGGASPAASPSPKKS